MKSNLFIIIPLIICLLSSTVYCDDDESPYIYLKYFFCRQTCSSSCPRGIFEGEGTKFLRNDIKVSEDRWNGVMYMQFKYDSENKTVLVQGNEGYVESFTYPIVNNTLNPDNENCILLANNRTFSDECFAFLVCNNSQIITSNFILIFFISTIMFLLFLI
ncbi:hypothetical protein ACTFIY_000211 [Dictyostelium cf. discoideum]